MVLCVNSLQPWSSITPTLVLFQKCKTMDDMNQMHARMITTGLINNSSLTTKLILTFVSSPYEPLVEFARHIFFKHHANRNPREQEDPFLWNAILRSYSHGCSPRGALAILCLMLELGVCLDKFSFSLVLKACSRVGLMKEGMQIHGLLYKLQIESDTYLKNCLISCFLRIGCVQHACQLFDRMSCHDSVSYNSMIDGYVKYGMVGKARELFDNMPLKKQNLITWNSMIGGYVRYKDGLNCAWNLFLKMPKRDLVSWNTMIDGCVKFGNIEDAQTLFNKMPKRDLVTWTTMIDGYMKSGNALVARRLFDGMPERNTISCNTMMAGYVQNGYCIEALKLFHDMRIKAHTQPDDTTLLIVLTAITQLGHVEVGALIHRYLENNNSKYLSGKLGVALIDMYSKCGSIENAILVFKNIDQKCVDHWNAMIGGLAIHGMGEMAINFLFQMVKDSVKPDDITFIGVLSACGHAGLLKEGLICFELMQRVYKVEPKVQHYGCMVDILCRAGHVEAAKKLVEVMPIKPNDVIWRTLLSGCQIHKNFLVGKPVTEELIKLNSFSPSSYVLLSNVYASVGMWDNVKMVRTVMKERNLKKIPGCSWIELEGVIHQFSVQDKSHSQVKEIYSMLSGL
ncbi:pentatricopeptide repeat-containing protein At2g45350, chloroplastic-like [Neltuma alba]|uniref:pentatricopeptide repeat-containing protein At2g45350, chloroplastic-like n=1 Tax=Neltuma alba TaxID=207710 RepID=UPI0010A2F996|nr:pentatricopeptide repeat-containing protein At2g45350, chloroplastic-like [Prosopis alba]